MAANGLISLSDLFSYSNTAATAQWQQGKAYTLGNTIVDPANHLQKCTTPGTSGSSIPTFNDAGGTTPDSSPLVWTDQGNSIATIAQEIIDGWTEAVYWITGRTSPMLTEPTEFTETYNGSGSDVLYLKNVPILSVASLGVSGVGFSVSAAFGQAGFFVQQDGKSIALRSGGGSGYPFPAGAGRCMNYKFARGRGNVQITYTAGYDGCPADLYLLSLKQCSVFLQKRLREDEASHMIPQSGQTNYRAWATQPEVLQFLQPYIRTAMTNIFGAA